MSTTHDKISFPNSYLIYNSVISTVNHNKKKIIYNQEVGTI